MADETELASTYTALVPEKGLAKLGTLVVTADRVVFFDQKFAPNAAFGLASLITDALQKRHDEGGPLLAFARADVAEVLNERKLLNKDRMRVRLSDGTEHLFNDGYKELAELLRPAGP